MRGDLIHYSFVEIVHGIPVTLFLVLIGFLGGVVLAILIIVLQRVIIIKHVVNLYVFFFRGTPFFLQLYLIYYGLGHLVFYFPNFKGSILWEIFINPFFYAALALMLNSAAYASEIIKGSLRAIPYGQIESAIALGMSKQKILRRITIPQTFYYALPAYSNEIIALVKASSLASIITIMEITAIMSKIRAETYSFYEPFLVAGSCYLVINFVLINIFRFLEKRSHKWMLKNT